jgi:hypothetical protein
LCFLQNSAFSAGHSDIFKRRLALTIKNDDILYFQHQQNKACNNFFSSNIPSTVNRKYLKQMSVIAFLLQNKHS